MPRPQQQQPMRDMGAADAANGEPDAQEPTRQRTGEDRVKENQENESPA